MYEKNIIKKRGALLYIFSRNTSPDGSEISHSAESQQFPPSFAWGGSIVHSDTLETYAALYFCVCLVFSVLKLPYSSGMGPKSFASSSVPLHSSPNKPYLLSIHNTWFPIKVLKIQRYLQEAHSLVVRHTFK